MTPRVSGIRWIALPWATSSIRFADGGQLRWSFNDIKDDSFTWRGENAGDGGKTWKLEEEHHMKRRPSGRVKVGG